MLYIFQLEKHYRDVLEDGSVTIIINDIRYIRLKENHMNIMESFNDIYLCYFTYINQSTEGTGIVLN